MFRFLAQGDIMGLEHSRGNKRKMSKEAKSCKYWAQNAPMRMAGNFPEVVDTQVKGHQQETQFPGSVVRRKS